MFVEAQRYPEDYDGIVAGALQIRSDVNLRETWCYEGVDFAPVLSFRSEFHGFGNGLLCRPSGEPRETPLRLSTTRFLKRTGPEAIWVVNSLRSRIAKPPTDGTEAGGIERRKFCNLLSKPRRLTINRAIPS
jgi:hypothetical protein